jgi:methylenetetrahydrofolate dehydrogenase (NADP+)/methenyltetrahydrofolate cyclohydrolase/formyltetrahydrofolate synthetase
LEVLLRGSGRYSYAWLKEERNIWHPDRFSRFCQADFVDQLKVKAEQMFVLYGVLMQAEKP